MSHPNLTRLLVGDLPLGTLPWPRRQPYSLKANKRGLVGTYHHMSVQHLHRYTAEFDFRYNTRKISDAERTEKALKDARGKRLTYRQPCSLAA